MGHPGASCALHRWESLMGHFVYGPSKGFKAWGALSSRSEEGALQSFFSSRVLHFNAFTEYGGTHGAVTAMAVVVPAPRNILTCQEGGENLVQLLRPTGCASCE